jgi:hypothetical protein
MLYGLLLQVLFVGLAAHYLLSAEASVRSKKIVGGLLAASVLFAPWMPVYLLLAIQIIVSGYILVVYRLRVRRASVTQDAVNPMTMKKVRDDHTIVPIIRSQ